MPKGVRGSARHGTDSGYYRHLRQAVPNEEWTRVACEKCYAAHSEAEQERRRRRTGAPPRFEGRMPRRHRCSTCQRLDHLVDGVCEVCRFSSPREYVAGWVLRGAIQVPRVPIRSGAA